MQPTVDAYAAGMFDGEGWFEIARLRCKSPRHGRYEFRYQPQARLQIREEKIVDFLIESYGGSKSYVKKRHENHSDIWRWVVTGKSLLVFAKRVLPYLRCKNAQAQVSIKMMCLKHESGNRSISLDQYEMYTSLFNELKDLNGKGIGK